MRYLWHVELWVLEQVVNMDEKLTAGPQIYENREVLNELND